MQRYGYGIDSVEEFVRDNPDMPSRTIARILYARNPEGYISVESVRSFVRYLRGSNKRGNQQEYGKYGKYRK